jgi:hypothetical protein
VYYQDSGQHGFIATPVRNRLALSCGVWRASLRSLRWLRQMKAVSGREKDLLDLKNLPEQPDPNAT